MHSRDILDAETPAGGILIIAAGGIGDAILLAHLFPRLAGLAEDGEPVTFILRADAGRAAFLFSGLAQVEHIAACSGKGPLSQQNMARLEMVGRANPSPEH